MTTPTYSVCPTCIRPMAPRGKRVADHPGTVRFGALGKCTTCYQRDLAAGRRPAPTQSAEPRFKGPCDRCGVEAGERRHGLCRDCRDVLTVDEIRSWAA